MNPSLVCTIVFWLIVIFFAMIPFFFLVGIIGRLAGFRPGSEPGTVEKVFGWFGIIILGGLILGICVIAGFVQMYVISNISSNPQFAVPQPKPIPLNWDDKQMQTIYLSDLQEFNTFVGFGNFGKKGKLGYRCAYGDDIQVDGKKWPNAISTCPPSFGSSRVSYRLGGGFKLFKAWVALSDTDAPFHRIESPATFLVTGDGVLLWKADVRQNRQIIDCRLNVEGVDTLDLQVHCPQTNGNVRAVWLEPHILR